MKNKFKSILIVSAIFVTTFFGANKYDTNSNDVVLYNVNTSFVHNSDDSEQNSPIELNWKSSDLSKENIVTIGNYKNYQADKKNIVNFSDYDYRTIRKNSLIQITSPDLDYPDGDYTSVIKVLNTTNGGDNGIQDSLINIYKEAGCDLSLGRNGEKGQGNIYENYWYGTYEDYDGYDALYFRAIPALMHNYTIHERKINDWDELYVVNNIINNNNNTITSSKNLSFNMNLNSDYVGDKTPSIDFTIQWYQNNNGKIEKETFNESTNQDNYNGNFVINNIENFSYISIYISCYDSNHLISTQKNCPFNNDVNDFYKNNCYLDKFQKINYNSYSAWNQYSGNLNQESLYNSLFNGLNSYLKFVVVPEMTDKTFSIFGNPTTTNFDIS